jgi:hypothetical protein
MYIRWAQREKPDLTASFGKGAGLTRIFHTHATNLAHHLVAIILGQVGNDEACPPKYSGRKKAVLHPLGSRPVLVRGNILPGGPARWAHLRKMPSQPSLRQLQRSEMRERPLIFQWLLGIIRVLC